MACIFCQIVNGEIPAEVVYRGDGAVAFLDVHPLADGHTVVVPTGHVTTVEEMDPEAVAKLFTAVAHLAGHVRLGVGAAGSTIGINNGQATGQTVPHVHVHIVPRWPGDGGLTVHEIFKRKTSMSVQDAAIAIRDVLGT